MKMAITICNKCTHYYGLKMTPANKICQINPLKFTKNLTVCSDINEHPEFKIIIDSREQKPFCYSRINDPNFPGMQYVNDSLKTGDYSLVGFSDPEKHKHTITEERKSLEDLYGTVGNGRDRFERELERMEKFTYKCIIIEADLYDIVKNPPDYSRMPSKSVFRSLIAFSQRYNVQVWTCTNRSMAEKMAFLILDRFYKDYVGEFTKTGVFKPGRYFSFDE